MKKLYFILLMSCFGVKTFAQNTASPYSILGLGDIEKSSFDKTTGLGHAGVALTSDRYLLSSNPASLSFLSNPYYSNPFYFDVAVRYKNVNYSGDAVKNATTSQSNDLQFKKIAFAIKPKAKWGLSFGLMPFSNANYTFSAVKRVQGSNLTVDANYVGTGSTNLLYLSNSYSITPKLSIGVQTNLMFGQLSNSEYIYSAITDSVLATVENVFLYKLTAKGGFIYKDTINKDWNFSVGATAQLKSNIGARTETTVTNGGNPIKTTVLQENNYTSLPNMFTSGIALHYKSNYTFVADYATQQWHSVNSTYNNSNRFSVGFQYTNFATTRDNRGNTYIYEKYFFQGGFYQQQTYVSLKGININESGFTFGAGKQLSNSLAILGSIEIGSKGTTSNGLIKENIQQATLTVSYRDFWNTKKIKRYN